MHETVARVLRSCGAEREAPAGVQSSAEDAPQSLALIDADFDPARWSHDDWPALDKGVAGVVISRMPDADLVLPEASPVWRAVIDPPRDCGQQALLDLHEKGVRGVRFTLRGMTVDPDDMLRYADRLVPLGWHIDMELPTREDAKALERAEWFLLQMPVPLCFSGVVDFLDADASDPEGAALLLEFVHMGRFWLKLPGSRIAAAPDALQETVHVVADAAMAIRGDRLLWGSGAMPTTPMGAPLQDALDVVRRWFPDPALQRRILSSNPATLYGF